MYTFLDASDCVYVCMRVYAYVYAYIVLILLNMYTILNIVIHLSNSCMLEIN